MDHPLLPVADWFTSLPDITCPTCSRGLLRKDGDYARHRSGDSRQAEHEHPEFFEPEWIAGRFTAGLTCSAPRCWETVAVAGDFEVMDNPVFDPDQQYVERFRITYLRPAPALVVCPPKTSTAVRQATDAAAAVIWIDAPAAGNRLRLAVEELLTHQKIKQTSRNSKTQKRVWRTAHDRILEFGKRDPDVADVLLAIKWLGNAGSHDSRLTTADVLESAQLLSHALRLLYDPSDADLRRRAALINKRKGPAPRAAARRTCTQKVT